jgi:hypothetical protein
MRGSLRRWPTGTGMRRLWTGKGLPASSRVFGIIMYTKRLFPGARMPTYSERLGRCSIMSRWSGHAAASEIRSGPAAEFINFSGGRANSGEAYRIHTLPSTTVHTSRSHAATCGLSGSGLMPSFNEPSTLWRPPLVEWKEALCREHLTGSLSLHSVSGGILMDWLPTGTCAISSAQSTR